MHCEKTLIPPPMIFGGGGGGAYCISHVWLTVSEMNIARGIQGVAHNRLISFLQIFEAFSPKLPNLPFFPEDDCFRFNLRNWSCFVEKD